MERPGTGKGFCGTKKQQQSAAVPRRIDGPAFGTEILLPLLVLGRIVAELKKQQQSAAVPRRIDGPAFGTEILLPLLVLGRIVAELE